MRRHAIGSSALILATLLTACGESRYDQLKRQQDYETADRPKGNPADDVEKIPPDPTRDAMEPLLRAIYTGERLPDVLEAEIEGSGPGRRFEITPGLTAHQARNHHHPR